MLDKCLLKRVEFIPVTQSLNGGDLLALSAHRRDQAGEDSFAFHDHGAGPALTLVTANLGTNQAKPVAEHVYQQLVRCDLELYALAVDYHGQ